MHLSLYMLYLSRARDRSALSCARYLGRWLSFYFRFVLQVSCGQKFANIL